MNIDKIVDHPKTFVDILTFIGTSIIKKQKNEQDKHNQTSDQANKHTNKQRNKITYDQSNKETKTQPIKEHTQTNTQTNIRQSGRGPSLAAIRRVHSGNIWQSGRGPNLAAFWRVQSSNIWQFG